MSSVLLTIKTDSETKAQVKDFAAEIGVSTTAFVNMVVKQALRERRVVLTSKLEPTPYLEKIMKEAVIDRKAKRNYTTITNEAELDDFFKDL